MRRLHKAFLRYHDANNWPMLREALKRMGRADLIGSGKRHLIPAWQPAGTGEAREGQRSPTGAKRPLAVAAAATTTTAKPMHVRTQHTGLKGVSIPKQRPPRSGKGKR